VVGPRAEDRRRRGDAWKSAEGALHWAAEEAGRRGDDVLVVDSWSDPERKTAAAEAMRDGHDAVIAAVDRELGEAVTREAAAHPTVGFSVDVVEAPPAQALLEHQDDASLLVVGSRGRGGFASLLLGSVSHAVAAGAAVPVAVVRSNAGGGEVVVGVQGSAPGRKALRWAAEEARLLGAPLRPVLVWGYYFTQGVDGMDESLRDEYDEEQARSVLDQILSDVLGDDHGLDVRPTVCHQDPANALLERATGARLLVVGPRRGSLDHHLGAGSVTLRVLHHAPCAVVVVPEHPGGR